MYWVYSYFRTVEDMDIIVEKKKKKYLLGRIVEILWESMCHPPNTIFPLCQPIRSHPRSDTTRGSRTCNIHL